MDNKLHLKIGTMEVDYEGIGEIPNEKIVNLVSEILELLSKYNLPIESNESAKAGAIGGTPAGRTIQGTTATMAAKVGGGSGTDLTIAAAAYLTFVANQLSFTRQQLLEAMKLGTGYYKSSYSNNLSTTLQTLVKNNKLLETTKDNYSLSDPTKKELEAKLAT